MPGDEPLFESQLNSLYDALTKNDVAGGLELLRQIGDSRNTLALQPLLILLEFPDEQVRRSAAVALGKIGDASAVPPLVKALKDPAAAVREDAAYALGAIGDDRATGPLNNVPPDDPRVKKAAEYALVQIRRKARSYSLFGPQGTPSGFVTGKTTPSSAGDGGNGHHARPAEPPANKMEPVLQKAEASTFGQPEARTLKVVGKEGAGAQQKSELFAAFASFLFPGMGQLYNGEKITKALLYLIGVCIGTVLLFIPGFVIWAYGVYNAYKTAKKINAGELPFKKTEASLLVIYAIVSIVITVIFFIVLTILLAAVIAAFVFQLGGDMPSQYSVGISVARDIASNNVVIKNMGGSDASHLVGITVIANGTEVLPVSGAVTSQVGSSANYEMGINTNVIVTADFDDLSSQVIWVGTVY